jgi:hypothetical protein
MGYDMGKNVKYAAASGDSILKILTFGPVTE